MPNTCTICRHERREEIEDMLAVGNSLRDIAGQFQVSKSSIYRHQQCIAEELKKLKTVRSEQFNETLVQRLKRYRRIAEQFLYDEEKVFSALDRCYKQLDLEAKLTGAYQKKQENGHDAKKHRETLIEAMRLYYGSHSFEQEVEYLKQIYEAEDKSQHRVAVELELDRAQREINAVWEEAEINCQRRGYLM